MRILHLNYMKKSIPIWVSCISLLLSVIAVCAAFWRSPDLSFDYQGVIVGVLSLLVTVLIGWNLYTLIDLKGIRKELNQISAGTSLVLEKDMTVLESANWMIYHYLLFQKDPLGLEFRFIYHGVACLMHSSHSGDLETCNVITKGLLECLTDTEKISMKASSKNDILKLISLVKEPDKIKGFLELINKIALIRIS